jgi:hypothetical protein
MSTIDESPEINKKKKEQQGNIEGDELTLEKGKKLLVSVIYILLMVFGYFSISALILFGCKVAFAKLIPTTEDCKPYANMEPNITNNKGEPINEIECNIFETFFEDEEKSEKIKFKYFDYNAEGQKSSSFAQNSFLDWLREKNEKNSYRLLHYIYNIIGKLFVVDFQILSWLLGWLNRLPEILIIIFGPIIFLFFSCIIIGCSSIYYLWLSIITPFSIFLKDKAREGDLDPETKNLLKNKNITWDNLPEEYKWTDLCSWSWWFGLGFAFFILAFTLVFFAISAPLTTLIFIWCLITIFSYAGYKKEIKIVNEEPVIVEEKISVSKIIKETCGQYKKLIAFIVTILVVLSVFSNIGTVTGITSILVVISIYFGWIPITIFQKSNYDSLMSKYIIVEQPTKKCAVSLGDNDIKYTKKSAEDCSMFSNFFTSFLDTPIKTVPSNNTTATTTSSNKTGKTTGTVKAPEITPSNPTNTPNTNVNPTVDNVATFGSEESLNTNPNLSNPDVPNNPVVSNKPDVPNKLDVPNKPDVTNSQVVQVGGSRTPNNKTLSKYKKKYNILNF